MYLVCIYIYIRLCVSVCVWNIWIDVKLLAIRGWMNGLAVIHQWRHCLPMVIWRRDAFVTYLLHFRTWDVANPRTTMPFPNNLFSNFSICTVFAICQLISSSTGHGDGTFSNFSGLFTDPFLSRVIGMFLHVRCIPHQNWQRLFWASVWFMLDSSRWHEPFGECFSKQNVDATTRCLNLQFST